MSSKLSSKRKIDQLSTPRWYRTPTGVAYSSYDAKAPFSSVASASAAPNVAVVTPDQKVIAGTTAGAVLLSGGIAGLTAALIKANKSMGANLANTESSGSSGSSSNDDGGGSGDYVDISDNYVDLKPVTGTTKGTWRLIQYTNADGDTAYDVYNSTLFSGDDPFVQYLDVLGTKTVTVLQDGNMIEDSSGNILYTITFESESYVTNPFLYLKSMTLSDGTSLVEVVDGNLRISLAMDIEDFMADAEGILSDLASYMGVDVTTLIKILVIAITGDVVD